MLIFVITFSFLRRLDASAKHKYFKYLSELFNSSYRYVCFVVTCAGISLRTINITYIFEVLHQGVDFKAYHQGLNFSLSSIQY